MQADGQGQDLGAKAGRQADGVFLGRHKLGVQGEGVEFQPPHQGFGQGLMIVEGDFAQDLSAFGPQGGKEFGRVADAGEGDHAGIFPIHPHLQGLQGGGQDGFGQGPGFGKLGLGGGGADGHDQIGAGKANRDGFAQGACGQAAGIAEAGGGIDDDQGQILDHVGVLVAVIQQDDLSAGRLGQTHGSGAVAADEGGGEGGQQQGFVADFGGGVGGFDHLQRTLRRAAVTTADDGDAVAARQKAGDEGDGGGGFASAADIDIADADDRDRSAVAGAGHAAGGGGGIKPAQGGQQAGGKAGGLGRV